MPQQSKLHRASAAASKAQIELAAKARDNSCCAVFIRLLRLALVLCALAIYGVGMTLFTVASIAATDATQVCGREQWGNECIMRAKTSAATFAVGIVVCAFASLTIVTECCRAVCVARYYGFMALNFSKGLYAIFCGLGVAWLGSVYKMEQGDGGVLADMLYNAFFAVGMVNVGVGFVYAVFGCCNCIAMDPLKQEFADYAVALHTYRAIITNEHAQGPPQAPTVPPPKPPASSPPADSPADPPADVEAPKTIKVMTIDGTDVSPDATPMDAKEAV